MHSHSLSTITNMKQFILLLLLTQYSFANELSSAQHKAELASLELMAEIKAEMALHKAELASLELMAEIKYKDGHPQDLGTFWYKNLQLWDWQGNLWDEDGSKMDYEKHLKKLLEYNR